MPDGKHANLTGKVIGAFFKVYNALGYGFNETVYENALAYELCQAGLKVAKQQEIVVYFEGQVVGDYRAEIVVNDVVILERKGSLAWLAPQPAL